MRGYGSQVLAFVGLWAQLAVAENLDVRIFAATSGSSDLPQVQVRVPDGYSVIGGGAHVDWNGTDPGQLIVWSYPQDEQTWYAASKAHTTVSPMTLTAYALAIENPKGARWDVRISTVTSGASTRPTAVASVPDGYTMTGGGARAEILNNIGQLLVASFPRDERSWEARAKDHSTAQSGTITAYAIGVKSKVSSLPFPQVKLTSAKSSASDAPSALVTVADGCTITGGGAQTTWKDNEAGNMLVASSPLGQNAWFARSKAHTNSSPASVISYVLYVCDGHKHWFLR